MVATREDENENLNLLLLSKYKYIYNVLLLITVLMSQKKMGKNILNVILIDKRPCTSKLLF